MLIEGINPATISGIHVYKMRRCGTHPVKVRLFAKKHPILAALGFGPQISVLDYVSRSHVMFKGSNGRDIKYIGCKSLDEARRIRDECVDLLDKWTDDVVNGKCNFKGTD